MVMGLPVRRAKEGGWCAPTVLTMAMNFNNARQAEPDVNQWPNWLSDLM